MITIIYPFRNRELFRIKNSLDSLVLQSNQNFCVIFVDYGSNAEISATTRNLLLQYGFVKYVYSYHCDQPWSRSKAINIGLRQTETEYVFIADIDIIFHYNFVDLLYKLKNPKQSVYFQVGYLDKLETKELKKFENYTIVSKSISGGQGLSLFNLDSLLLINGFDEFFHCWGAEDEDVHSRLRSIGLSTFFYNDKILLLHQWHLKFENLEKGKLTIEPLFSDVASLNEQKLRFNQNSNSIKVNNENWGELLNKKDYDILKSNNERVLLLNKKRVVEYFINIILPNTHSSIINVRFIVDNYQFSLKYKIKKILGMKRTEYFSLKYINDLILLHLILYYKEYSYSYIVNSDLKSIDLVIKK